MSEANLAIGCLLVASPRLLDPNFARSVVLVVAHESEGSYGLVLNRPLGRRLGELLPGVDERAAGIAVLQGGPVQTEVLQLVSRVEGFGKPLLPGVSLGGGLDEMIEQQPDDTGLRAYLGYAGWGQGQLEDEVGEGSWIVAPARAEHVFDVEADQLWVRVLHELGGRYAWMAMDGGEPGDN